MDAIVARHLTKTFRIGVGRARVREMLPPPIDTILQKAAPRWWHLNTFKALNDVSFTVHPGAAVGLIGHNGAGKTTLLKLATRITSPTTGSIATSGRMAALIDILVGFHPDLTGRENVFMLGAVYGLGRKEVLRRLPQILAFAELESFADTPLKRYSTGMTARLGFATIISLDAELMLVDEILTVGDSAFQRKCINWFKEFRASGGTMLFVSHNMALIRSMTDEVIWLDHGRMIEQGPTESVLGRYARAMERRESETPMKDTRQVKQAMRRQGGRRWGSGDAFLQHVHIEEPTQGRSSHQIKVAFEIVDDHECLLSIGFVDEAGRQVGGTISPPVSLTGRTATVTCSFDPLPLHTGIYFPVVAILSHDGKVRDRWRLDRAIVIEENGHPGHLSELGPVLMDAAWNEATEEVQDA